MTGSDGRPLRTPDLDPAPRGQLEALSSSNDDATANLEALGEVDRQGRVGRTAVQVGLPSSIVAIGTWVLALAHVDLDPGPGTDMPAVIVAAWISIVTVLLARRMNRRS